jgi:hypothetical protein
LTPSLVTTDNFATTPVYSLALIASMLGNKIYRAQSDYNYIYISMYISRNNDFYDRSTFYSSDYGTTFTDIKAISRLLPRRRLLFIPACSSTGEIVYISVQTRSTNKTSIIKSTDRGTTWSLIKNRFKWISIFRGLRFNGNSYHGE